MPLHWLARNRVGRLVETRIWTFDSVADVDALLAEFRGVIGAIASETFVICADYRKLRVLPPDVTERFVDMIKSQNPRIERSAILCSPEHATAALQVERTVRAAGHDNRRSFRDVGAGVKWLGEVLTHEERLEVARFVAADEEE